MGLFYTNNNNLDRSLIALKDSTRKITFLPLVEKAQHSLVSLIIVKNWPSFLHKNVDNIRSLEVLK